MPPRPVRSNSNSNNTIVRREAYGPSPVPLRQHAQAEVVYQNNLKVLQRREPSIRTIFDQFSHVCLYNFNGTKWEKQGYEGSMFLFEKQTYPTYGFFILNRMGTEDYIRPIYPEDDMDIVGQYVMYRFYPDFTRKRLELRLPYPIPDEYRAIFDEAHDRSVEDPQASAGKIKEKKGKSTTIGLWMFATDSREPLTAVMMRLHSCIKQGIPYPEEYRYDPGHPPPLHLRATSRGPNLNGANNAHEEQTQPQFSTSTSSNGDTVRGSTSPSGASLGSSSVLDSLFANLMSSSSNIDVQAQAPAPTVAPSSSMSAQKWFAVLQGEQSVEPAPPAPAPAEPLRGPALLNLMFESVKGTTTSATSSSTDLHADFATPTHAQPVSLPAHPEEIEIASPRPTTSALPQILNQDVIASILGLPASSRASSAAPSSTGSRRSGQNRYEGDNEESDEPISEGEYSVTSTVLDAEADPAGLAAGSSSGLPQFSYPGGGSDSDGVHTSNGNQWPPVHGDVTPRAPARAFGPMSPPTKSRAQYLSSSLAAGAASPSGDGPVPVQPANTQGPRPRALVPFEPDSELWPYPRAPVDERSVEQEDSEIVELDFADTSVLSDPAAFSSRLKERQTKANGRKKSKRERALDRERERIEIEKGWDPVRTSDAAGARSVVPLAAPNGSAVVNGAQVVLNLPTASGVVSNGAIPNGAAPNGKGKQVARAPPEQASAPHGSDGLDNNAVRAAILSVLNGKNSAPVHAMNKKDFVRELRTLVCTNESFTDALWHDYAARTS